MAQLIKPANIWGRIGTGLGKGLAEQLPKEIERGRLSAGLKNLGEQKGLSPFQQFAGLISQPGITPQGVQTGGELLRQQAYLDALKNQYEGQGGPQTGKGGYVPTQEELSQPLKGEIPSLATPEDTAQSYKNFIPPPEQEERRDAFENFNKNPARYGYNFENALNERKAITSRNQEIQKAHQGQEATAVEKEETVKKALENESKKLGLYSPDEKTGKDVLTNIPPKAYQNFEEKVLNSVLSKKEGGEGLTQEQAIKKYSEQLREANRNYADLGSLDISSPIEFNRQIDSLRPVFSSRGELQLMADQLSRDYKISPSYAAHKAYPIKKGEIPTINKNGAMNNIAYEKIKKEMGKTHSPLSVAYELQQKDHDPRAWLNYLKNHRDNLDGWQIDELSKPINVFDLRDMWLRAFEER